MSFYPEKCTALRITTNKRYRREANYSLHGQRLQVTDSAKYLGVTISDELQSEKLTHALHVPLDFLDAFSGIAENRFVTLHTSPWSEQQWPTSTSWDPYKVEYINGLDKVQRRAARCASNNYTERTPGEVTVLFKPHLGQSYIPVLDF